MKSSATVSWKTTLLGVFAAVPLLIGEIQALIDDDPQTQFSVERFLSALAIMGVGAVARDGSKSSQDHRIR